MKLVYVLWRSEDRDRDRFARELVESAKHLLDGGARRLVLHTADVDADFGASVPIRSETGSVAGLASLELDPDAKRKPIEATLAGLASRIAGYRVTESVPVAYTDRDWPDGERSPGVTLLTLLVRNPGLTHRQFMHEWHEVHTPLSLEVHPMWSYVRNVVDEVLTPGAPRWPGIVTESFRTLQHVTDPKLFYGGEGNAKRVLEHVSRFLDLPKIETYLMNEYIMRSQS